MGRKAAGLFVFLIAIVFGVQIAAAQSQSRTFVYSSSKPKGKLGVMIQDITPKVKEKNGLSVSSGALVTDVEEGSAADKAGIEEGDVIVKFKDKEISDASDLTNAVQKTKAGTEAAVELVRKDAHKTLTVKVGKPDAEGFAYSFGGRPFAHIPSIPKMNMNLRMLTEQGTSGMELQELTKQLADYFEVPGRRGLLVTSVEKGSDAEKAGVKAGDVILKLNSSSVSDMDDLRDEMESAHGKDVGIEVLRKGKTVSLSMHLTSERDDEGDDDDDAYLMPQTLPCPQDHVGQGIQGKIFSRDFLRQLVSSIHELKDRIVHEISTMTEKARTTLVSFHEKKSPAPEPFRQS